MTWIMLNLLGFSQFSVSHYHEGRKVRAPAGCGLSGVFGKIGASRYLLRCIHKISIYPGEQLGATFLNGSAFGNRFFRQLASPSITQLSVFACFFGYTTCYIQNYPGIYCLLAVSSIPTTYHLFRLIPGKSLSASMVQLLHQACNGTWYWTRKAPSQRPLAGRRRVDFGQSNLG